VVGVGFRNARVCGFETETSVGNEALGTRKCECLRLTISINGSLLKLRLVEVLTSERKMCVHLRLTVTGDADF
jgi:hypothetical protein